MDSILLKALGSGAVPARALWMTALVRASASVAWVTGHGRLGVTVEGKPGGLGGAEQEQGEGVVGIADGEVEQGLEPGSGSGGIECECGILGWVGLVA